MRSSIVKSFRHALWKVETENPSMIIHGHVNKSNLEEHCLNLILSHNEMSEKPRPDVVITMYYAKYAKKSKCRKPVYRNGYRAEVAVNTEVLADHIGFILASNSFLEDSVNSALNSLLRWVLSKICVETRIFDCRSVNLVHCFNIDCKNEFVSHAAFRVAREVSIVENFKIAV